MRIKKHSQKIDPPNRPLPPSSDQHTMIGIEKPKWVCSGTTDEQKLNQKVSIQYNLKKSNAKFILDYGFVDLMPDRVKYMLTLKISKSDPYFGDKLDIAESNDLGQSACFDIILDRPLPPTMFPYLRLIALGGSDAFLLESSFTDSIWRHLELPVSCANED